MEVVLHYDKEVKAHVVKNLGLAYMHMVRLKEHPTLDLPRVPFTDVFKGVLPEIDVWYRRERETDWKGWATKRYVIHMVVVEGGKLISNAYGLFFLCCNANWHPRWMGILQQVYPSLGQLLSTEGRDAGARL